MSRGKLGRLEPKDWDHLNKYPLTASTTPLKPTPGVIGVNWYVEFDRPEQDSDGSWWIARDGNLTSVRGGHCVCVQDSDHHDYAAWWDYYNQVAEGKCVGEGWSRALTLVNKRRYDPTWLWQQARLTDEYPDNDDLSDPDQGTSVRAAGEILRTTGHRWVTKSKVVKNGQPQIIAERPPSLDDGIAAYRWATSVDDFLAALGTPDRDYVTILNSWGRSYPRRVKLPATVLETLRQQGGELAIFTDR